VGAAKFGLTMLCACPSVKRLIVAFFPRVRKYGHMHFGIRRMAENPKPAIGD